MIRITIYNRNNEIIGFESVGHAGYDDVGHDIICASVSILTYTTMESIDAFTDDKYEYDIKEEDACIRFVLTTDTPSHDAVLLLKAFQKGITMLVAGEGSEYIELFFKEV